MDGDRGMAGADAGARHAISSPDKHYTDISGGTGATGTGKGRLATPPAPAPSKEGPDTPTGSGLAPKTCCQDEPRTNPVGLTQRRVPL